MITRLADQGGKQSCALYSDCENYRFLLTRRWGQGAAALFILLNPSTASEVKNDPTVERCERRALAMGFAGFAVANLFALRSTDPAGLRRSDDPVGPDNDAVLMKAAATADMVLCGWGTNGAYLGRGAAVLGLLRGQALTLSHLGLTQQGYPRHPLYVGYSVTPQNWGE